MTGRAARVRGPRPEFGVHAHGQDCAGSGAVFGSWEWSSVVAELSGDATTSGTKTRSDRHASVCRTMDGRLARGENAAGGFPEHRGKVGLAGRTGRILGQAVREHEKARPSRAAPQQTDREDVVIRLFEQRELSDPLVNGEFASSVVPVRCRVCSRGSRPGDLAARCATDFWKYWFAWSIFSRPYGSAQQAKRNAQDREP